MLFLRRKFLLLPLCLLTALCGFTACDDEGTTTTFKGIVTDSQTGAPVSGATVTVMPLSLVTNTDENGAYAIKLPRTSIDVYLVIACTGYDTWQSESMPLAAKKVKEYTHNVSLVSRIPKVSLSTQTVDFEGEKVSYDVTLSNPGTDVLHWSFLEMYFPAWLTVTPLSGELAVNAQQTLTFAADRTSLPLGTQQATVQLLGGAQPVEIQVSVTREGAVLSLSQAVFDFAEANDTYAATLGNGGNIALQWQLEKELPAWLGADATAGRIEAGAQQILTFTADRSSLDYGSHSFSTRLTSNGGDTLLQFSLTRTQDLLKVTPAGVDFGSESVSRQFTVAKASGIHDLAFTVATDDPCLSLSLTGGTLTTQQPSLPVEVTLDREKMPLGGTTSKITVTTADQTIDLAVTYASAANLAEVRTDGTTLSETYAIRFTGTLTSNGGGSVTEHGHCWGTMEEPTLENAAFSSLGPVSEGVSFASDFTGELQEGVTYYYRAYATNEVGTAYGEVRSIGYQPAVLTKPTISVSSENFSCRSNASGFGDQALVRHGFCLSRSENPTITDNEMITDLGGRTSEGNFYGQFNKLQRGVLYYVRAFAINASGLVYSPQNSQQIQVMPPEITTLDGASNIQLYSAVVGGNLLSFGSESVVTYGHCWNITGAPTVQDSKTDLGPTKILGEYNSSLTGLRLNTTYYYRAYVTTGVGTYYGQTYSFNTLNDPSVPLSEGLLMYLTTDHTPKAYDWTGSAAHLSISSGVSYNSISKPAGATAAISLNGTSGYLLSPDFNPLSGVNKGTINIWVRMRSTMSQSLAYPLFGSITPGGMYADIRYSGDDGAWVLTFCLGLNQSTYRLVLPSVAGIDISSLLGTDWHMLTIVSTGSSMTVYIDGTSMATRDINMTFGVQKDFVMGANALNSNVLNTFIPADFACLRFYNITLNEAAVKQLFSAGM